MSSFKVAIVGGSVAGLTLALHLEKLGIDWVLLERHHEIAPQLGASINLAPNGLQLLNQLGCFEDVDQKAYPMEHVTTRNGNGTILYGFDIFDRVRVRHGFDICFTERRILLEILHSHIKNKDKVMTNQKITRIDHVGDKVQLSTNEGRAFGADIAVGADGIHSRVRGEMWRIASKEDPRVNTEYGCIFGISNPTNDLKAGEDFQVHDKGLMLGVMIGSDEVVYWFLIFACPEILLGLDFPRYSEDDEAAMVKAHSQKLVKDGTVFGDLYRNKRVSHMTPLPHHCFDRWHYKRIMCVGDSAHKFNPVNGQGGCNAIESSIALGDNIHAALRANDGKPLSDKQVDAVFQQTTEIRKARVTALVDESMRVMRLGAWSNKAFEFIDNYVMWLVPGHVMVDLMAAPASDGYKSSTLPQPAPKHNKTASEEEAAGRGRVKLQQHADEANKSSWLPAWVFAKQ
ncbi:putative fad binding domain protein [Eutypa lata UCREL1]|uniref:Putative fad binding domain protein n=1 Tax=Eutypa lata (strain UCR-EL1) TaxID=1287681 RepID=M7TF03_EUTLA|nr:putative fad binding domain protein [Eutypa lata UCREL1]